MYEVYLRVEPAVGFGPIVLRDKIHLGDILFKIDIDEEYEYEKGLSKRWHSYISYI